MVAALLLSLSLASAVPAPGEVAYRTLDEDSHALLGEETHSLLALPDGRIRGVIAWSNLADSTRGEQRFLLGEDSGAQVWTVDSPAEATAYTGRREGNVLVVEGTLAGEPLDRRIELSDKPFFPAPALCLQAFVRSGREELEFHTLRPDNLSEYTMRAKVEERTLLTIDGSEMEAVRVKWGLTGLRAAFFKRHLWFRASDGLFLRSRPADGRYTVIADPGGAPVPTD